MADAALWTIRWLDSIGEVDRRQSDKLATGEIDTLNRRLPFAKQNRHLPPVDQA